MELIGLFCLLICFFLFWNKLFCFIAILNSYVDDIDKYVEFRKNTKAIIFPIL